MRTKVKRLLPAAVFSLASVCGSVWAQQTAAANTGLGQAWPNAADVSASPNWHVYVFERDGVRFIQINDLNGNVRSAFATANGQLLVLPSGLDATLVASAPSLANTQQIVYDDGAVRVGVRAGSHGPIWEVASINTTTPTNSTQPQSAASMICSDPVKCNSSANAVSDPGR